MFAVEKQPAYLLYPCDRGWRIIKYVRANLFARTAASANTWYTQGQDYKTKSEATDNGVGKYWLICIAGGFYLAGLAQYLSALLFVALFVTVQLIVLAVLFAASVVMIFLLATYNKAYSLWFQAHYRCPGCHESMMIPVFTCPACATDHTRLWPSMYGVLHHRCSGCTTTKLATTEWNGRRAVDRKCPHCSRPLNVDIGTLTNVHVPVVGGPSTGKSNLIVMATHEFIRSSQTSGRAEISFPDSIDEREFQSNLGRLQSGRELVKTPSIVPQAYNLSIKRPRDLVGKIVYFYDGAGEAYSDETSTLQQTYYKFVHGIIFVIDPFGLPALREELKAELDDVRTVLRPGPIGVMESYERMLTVLEANVGLTRRKQFPHPLAVVVTKVDAFGLEEKVGAPAARQLLEREPQIGTEAAAIDSLVQGFLETYGLDQFIRDALIQFQSVRFFSCSALGRMPNEGDTRPFVPVRVLEPLEWVLRQLRVIETGQEAPGVAVPVRRAAMTQ